MHAHDETPKLNKVSARASCGLAALAVFGLTVSGCAAPSALKAGFGCAPRQVYTPPVTEDGAGRVITLPHTCAPPPPHGQP